MTLLLAVMGWLGVVFVPCVFAQEKVEDQPRESEEETVARCVNDLKSADVAVRRRAAMLLGKYPLPEARAALVKCLHDTDAQIRLGALVSLTEDHQMLPPEAEGEVTRLLSDADVHVRRLASSLLATELSGISASRVIISGNVVINRNNMLSDQQRDAVLKALGDEDASVRRNVLTACRMCGIAVPHEVLRGFLSDPSVEIRLLALQLYGRLREKTVDMLAEISVLANDSAPQVRLELCRDCMQFGPGCEPLLRGFVNDEAAEVRVAAVCQLARLHVTDAMQLLAEALSEKGLSTALRRQLVDALRLFPIAQSKAMYQRLLEGDSAELSALAMQCLCRSDSGVEVEFFIPYLEHDSSSVANSALQGMKNRLRSLTSENVSAMLSSRNRAAREYAVRYGLAKVSKEAVGDLVMEACMDEDPLVRLAAIQQVGKLRPDGWTDILTATLEDDDPRLQETAATMLCSVRSANVMEALRNYLPHCRNMALAARIRALLKRQPKKP